MAQPTLEILLKLKDEASRGLADASKGVENMGKTYKAAGLIMVGAATAIAGTLALCVNAAGQEEKSINLLSVAMRNVGLNYDQTKDSLESWMDTQTKKTGTDDEAQRKSLAALILQTKDLTKAQDLMTVAMDIAAGTGRDLEDATHLVAMAMAGNWGRLQLLIPAIKAAKTEEEKWMVLRNAFAGQGEVLGNSFVGQMTRIKTSIGELAESIGSTLLPVATKAADIASDLLTWLGKLPKPIIYIGVTCATATAGVLALVGGLSLLKWALPGAITSLGLLGKVAGTLGLTSLLSPLGWVAAGIGTLAAIGVVLWKVFDKDKESALNVSDSMYEVAGAIQYLNNQIEQENSDIETTTEALKKLETGYQHDQDNAAGYRDELKRLNDSLGKHQDELATARDKLSSLEKKYNEAKNSVSNFEQKIADANRELQGLASPNLVGMQASRDAIQATQEQIDLLELQKATEGELNFNLQENLDALYRQRDILEAQAKVDFGPMLYALEKAATAAQGLGAEVTPKSAFDRITELAKSLAPGGDLSSGLENAQTDLGNVTIAYIAQQGAVDDLTQTVKAEQGELDTLNEKIQAVYDTWETQILQQKNLIYDLGVVIEETQAKLDMLNSTPPSPLVLPNKLLGEGSFWNVPGMQTGGIVTRPTLAMIGESGPEAIVPLSRSGGIGAGNTYITVHNHIQGSIWNNSDLANEVRKNLLWIKDRNYSLGLA